VASTRVDRKIRQLESDKFNSLVFMIVIKHFNRLWHPIPGNHYFAQNTVLNKVVISRYVGMPSVDHHTGGDWWFTPRLCVECPPHTNAAIRTHCFNTDKINARTNRVQSLSTPPPPPPRPQLPPPNPKPQTAFCYKHQKK